MKQFEILQPKTVHDVCSCLDKYKHKSMLHAGGTDLLVRLRAGLICPSFIIDLSKVASLKTLAVMSQGTILIGSMVTIAELSSMPVIKTRYQALYEALESIGSPQIRNRGTLAGNICNASPAADCLPPMLIFGAGVNIRGVHGSRKISVDELITGPGTTSLEPDEFVESIELPEQNGEFASAYMKIGRRKAVDCSIVGTAVRLGVDQSVRAAFGAVAAKPFRAESVEKHLTDRTWQQELVEQASILVRSEVTPIDDIRASKEYRQEMSVVLFKRVFDLANERLGRSVHNG